MRGQVKPGQKAAYEAAMRDMIPSAEDYGKGLHSIEFGWEDKNPDAFVAIIHFRDRDSYVANADAPETDAQYRQQLEFLVGPPEWIDVNYAGYMGKPLAEGAMTA